MFKNGRADAKACFCSTSSHSPTKHPAFIGLGRKEVEQSSEFGPRNQCCVWHFGPWIPRNSHFRATVTVFLWQDLYEMWQWKPGVPTNILEHKATPQWFTAQLEAPASTKAGASGWAVNKSSQDATHINRRLTPQPLRPTRQNRKDSQIVPC